MAKSKKAAAAVNIKITADCERTAVEGDSDEEDVVAVYARPAGMAGGPDASSTVTMTKAEAHLGRRDFATPAAPTWGEPVAWIRWEWNRSGSKTVVFEKPATLSLREEAIGVVYDPLYAAPPSAAQAEAASDIDPNEADPGILWSEIIRLRAAIQGPDGFSSWQDAATAERIRRVRAEKELAALSAASKRIDSAP